MFAYKLMASSCLICFDVILQTMLGFKCYLHFQCLAFDIKGKSVFVVMKLMFKYV